LPESRRGPAEPASTASASPAGLPRGKVVLQWLIRFDELRRLRKGDKLESPTFDVPGITSRFHAWFFPKGSVNAERRNASVFIEMVQPGQADGPLTLKTEFYREGELEPIAEAAQHSFTADSGLCCDSIATIPKGDVTITVTHSFASSVGCLRVGYHVSA
jgi:hypothetical protein